MRASAAFRPHGDMFGLRSVLAWFFVGLWGVFALMGGVLLLFAGALIWDRQRRVFHGLARWWATTVIRVHFWTVGVEVRGHAHLRDGPFVITPNHQSMVDLLVLYLLPVSYRTLVKRSWAWTPLGLNIWLAGYVFTPRDRSNTARQRMLVRCAQWLRSGHSILIFPEGTRARDRAVGTFRQGAFQLSTETNRAILPVAIAGTDDVSHPGTWRFSFARCGVIVEILPPLSPDGRTPRELAHVCRAMVEDRVDKLRQELFDRFGQGPQSESSGAVGRPSA